MDARARPIRDVDRISQSAKRHGLFQQILWIARQRWGDLCGDYKVASAEFGTKPVAHPSLRLREMTKASSQNHKPPGDREGRLFRNGPPPEGGGGRMGGPQDY